MQWLFDRDLSQQCTKLAFIQKALFICLVAVEMLLALGFVTGEYCVYGPFSLIDVMNWNGLGVGSLHSKEV